ncbi:hypothetical protein L596_008760 [Steinernema carpocapsae]|uniref:G-protein coupled receptors family 1 profile domain-containing protein n=1 Tax=Steinernema carpocapsae TaxID=34508 RepID=A0A4U5PEK4_STECR|nr:hypothetical protein L596_008760 [Steinernema carpocapsae]
MVFELLSGHIIFGFLNILCFTTMLLPSNVLTLIRQSHTLNTMIQALIQLNQQMVSVSSAFMALDRVLIMAVPIKYAFHLYSPKLAVSAVSINAVISCLLIGCYFILPDKAFVSKVIVILRDYVFSSTLLFEVLLYAVFVYQFRSYQKCRVNSVAKQLTAQRNHIVIFQMVSHTTLCAVPNAFTAVSWFFNTSEEYVTWIEFYVDPYRSTLFATSVLLSSSFTLFKLKPKKNFLKIAFTGINSSTLRRT